MPAAPLLPPILSAYDPAEGSEGGVDPLQLQATYERLAERIYPDITVRMRRLRFLTAIAAAAHACAPLRDEIAADGVTPPWLAFEWHVVEGVVRSADGKPEGAWRVPGNGKVRDCIRRGHRVSHATYLKTAKIFGYTGIHKPLAVGLGIIDRDVGLDEQGHDLLRAWERDDTQRQGFVDGNEGPGATMREDLRRAVRRALEAGHVDQPARWAAWAWLARHFDVNAIGPAERACLSQLLLSTASPRQRADLGSVAIRSELLGAMERGGRALTAMADEPPWFRAVMASDASAELRDRLALIDAYEAACGPIERGLQLLLHLSTIAGNKPINADDFAASPLAATLAARLATRVPALAARVAGTPWQPEMREILERHADTKAPGSLFEALVDHHEFAQRSKPPDGKRPWFERMGGSVVVRPQYQHPKPPPDDDLYVHWYRTGTAATFLQDLGRLPS